MEEAYTSPLPVRSQSAETPYPRTRYDSHEAGTRPEAGSLAIVFKFHRLMPKRSVNVFFPRIALSSFRRSRARKKRTEIACMSSVCIVVLFRRGLLHSMVQYRICGTLLCSAVKLPASKVVGGELRKSPQR